MSHFVQNVVGIGAYQKVSHHVSHFRRQVPGCPWAAAPMRVFPSKAQSEMVSFSFTEGFSFSEDILVKLLWLG